jgi:hypothetical protein
MKQEKPNKGDVAAATLLFFLAFAMIVCVIIQNNR